MGIHSGAQGTLLTIARFASRQHGHTTSMNVITDCNRPVFPWLTLDACLIWPGPLTTPLCCMDRGAARG
jgi:hypothetical protein